MEWLTEALGLSEFTWDGVLWALVGFVIASVGGVALVSFLVAMLPATYFCDGCPRPLRAERHPILRWTGRVLKNIAGAAAVLLGLMLSLPGIPGPGLLLILVGLTLLDVPGKRRLERKLVERPKVLHALNALRKCFGRPPLVLADEPAKPGK